MRRHTQFAAMPLRTKDSAVNVRFPDGRAFLARRSTHDGDPRFLAILLPFFSEFSPGSTFNIRAGSIFGGQVRTWGASVRALLLRSLRKTLRRPCALLGDQFRRMGQFGVNCHFMAVMRIRVSVTFTLSVHFQPASAPDPVKSHGQEEVYHFVRD